MTGLDCSQALIEERERGTYLKLLDNPDRPHEPDGVGPIVPNSGTREAQIAPMRLTDEAMILPSDPQERKNIPITSGVLDYFPLAIAEVARVSKAGNDQHNPGQPLHWAKEKSTDHADCIPRHLIDRFSRDTDGQRHAAKMAWRALAFLQILLENEAKA